ncbi:MAG: cupredoxin domain-containing protein [Pseudomonadota bacterium]|nr:cupredoxin domain-containing protein [Pseudomonadota bacterium]
MTWRRRAYSCPARPRLVLGVVTLSLVGLPSLAAFAAGPVTVEQQDRMFQPRELHVQRGDSVRFTNNDPFVHQIYVTSDAFQYESGLQEPGSTKEIAFTTRGTFQVRCAIHPRMALNVDVQ